MIREEFKRTALLLGEDGVLRLEKATVAVFGIGGVGGSAVEALARAGVGRLVLIDGDEVSPSNINRQAVALRSTLGMKKTEAARKRILDINPECEVIAYPVFYGEETRADFDFSQYDYVIDAIDDVPAKIDIIVRASESGTKIISAMGAGNKLDPTGFRVADIYKTEGCALSRAVRTRLKKLGVKHHKVVFSKELPVCERRAGEPVGSVSFVPPVMGMILAGEVIKELASEE